MEDIIRYYFEKNYQYKIILEFLDKFHDVQISKRTLIYKLKEYGLSRRGNIVNREFVRECIQQEFDGSGQLLGYRAMWKRIQAKYRIRPPRLLVQTIVSELNPEGSSLRRAHRLQRRRYLNPGPNYCWHADRYDKLKPFGFPIHGCIDGFSRKIMWLVIIRTNNNPHVVGKLFLECIKGQQSCPTVFRTDKGTENGIMAAAQSFLRRDHLDALSGVQAHRYGSSHSNQRVEAWWAMLRRSWSSWWINFFKDLVSDGVLDTSNELHMECLWFCFIGVIRRGLDENRESWNGHYVRKSRYYTAHGIPNQLYYLPESFGAIDHQKPYVEADLQEIESHVNAPVEDDSHSIYQEYFVHISGMLDLQEPQNWRESLEKFKRLTEVAE